MNDDADSNESAGGESDPQRAVYVAALRTLDGSLDRMVMATDVEQETPHSLRDIVETFGSWQAALDAADIDVRGQICDELLRLHETLGHPPSPEEVNEHGYISATMVRKNFESFDAALDRVIDTSEAPARTDAVVDGLQQGLAAAETLSRATAVSARRTYDRLRDEVASLADRAPTTDRLDHDRRQFLKYASLSVTVASATSSSDAIFGSDEVIVGIQRFGYGGIPLNGTNQFPSGGVSDLDPSDDSGDDRDGGERSSPVPLTSPTPTSAGESQVSDDGPTIESTPTPTPESDEQTQPTNGGSATGGTGSTETGGTPQQTESGKTIQPTEDGSGTEDTQTPTDVDRYADLQDTEQNYGEGGYGGYTAS